MKATRELQFGEQPFTWVGGEEFSLTELMPEVVEDELLTAPGHVSALDYPLFDETISGIPGKVHEPRHAKIGKDAMDNRSCRERDLTLEELSDSVGKESRGFFPPSLFRQLKRMKGAIASKVEAARRIESADGRVILVLRHA